jgi:hypothetical protein
VFLVGHNFTRYPLSPTFVSYIHEGGTPTLTAVPEYGDFGTRERKFLDSFREQFPFYLRWLSWKQPTANFYADVGGQPGFSGGMLCVYGPRQLARRPDSSIVACNVLQLAGVYVGVHRVFEYAGFFSFSSPTRIIETMSRVENCTKVFDFLNQKRRIPN